MENWIVLDEELRPAWEREATRRVSEIVGYDVAVSLRLPTEDAARTARKENVTLCGAIAFKPAWDAAKEFALPLPYQHGDDPVENPTLVLYFMLHRSS